MDTFSISPADANSCPPKVPLLCACPLHSLAPHVSSPGTGERGMRKSGRWMPAQYLRPARPSASALEERTRRWPRDGDPVRRGSWPCPKCAQQRLGLSRCPQPALPGSLPQGHLLPAPGKVQGEFAPRNVGHSFGTPNHLLAEAGIPAPYLSRNFPRRTRSRRGHPRATPPPSEAPRPGRSRTVLSPVRGSSEAPAAAGAFGPRRRPARPRNAAAAAGASAAPARNCSAAVLRKPQEAQSRAPAARRLPRVPPHCVSLPGAGTHRRRESAPRSDLRLRRAEDPPSLQDGRGFPPTGRFEGRELSSWSDRDGGRGFPLGNDKVGGDSPPNEAHRRRASLG